MKKLGTISVTQRTAVGHDQSETTKMYVVENVHSDNGDIAVMSWEDAKSYRDWNGSNIVGYYEIQRPWLLAGSWEENISDFARIVLREMDEQGLLTYNDYGTAFLK